MKFTIKDKDGSEYTVEEMIEEKTTEDAEETEIATLTEDEIRALKSLAASATQILELLNVEKKEHEAVSDDEIEEKEIVEDEDEDEEDEDEIDEEVVMDEDEDEDEEKEEILETKSYDSKKSFGSIERKTQKVDDSLTDSVSEAWAKRYNGGIK